MKLSKKLTSLLVSTVCAFTILSMSSSAEDIDFENNDIALASVASGDSANGYCTVKASNSYYPANNKVVGYSVVINNTNASHDADAYVWLYKGSSVRTGTLLSTGDASFTLSANGGSNSASCYNFVSSGWITVQATGTIYVGGTVNPKTVTASDNISKYK